MGNIPRKRLVDLIEPVAIPVPVPVWQPRRVEVMSSSPIWEGVQSFQFNMCKTMPSEADLAAMAIPEFLLRGER